MHIIHNTKVDNWIKGYNRRVILKEGNTGFSALIHRIAVSLILNKKEESDRGIERIAAYMESNSYLERYEKWLKRHRLYMVSFDRIAAVLINTEIKSLDGKDLTGYAFRYDNGFYVLVYDAEEMEVTISILTHEIMHTQLEDLLNQVEQDRDMVIPESAKEEMVTILEHAFLREELDIKAWDLQPEKVRLFLNLMETGVEKAITRWVREYYIDER